jgi:Methylase involved in ubiquinone/menaquinone biosynthesis
MPPQPEPTALQATLTFIQTIVVTFAALAGVWKVTQELGNQKKLFKESQNLKEREAIRHKLNNFYGPFKALRTESRLLYDAFAKGPKLEVKERTGKDFFRTLRYLAEGQDFVPTDRAILEEILRIEQKEIDLIEKEGWAVSNLRLNELLGKFATHIRLLALAAEHKIDGMSEDLKEIVYPRELDGAIESEIRKLEYRYNQLLNPDAQNKMINLTPLEKETINFYENNALEYYNQTAYVDMQDLYTPFITLLPRGGLILDAGCGVGRDTRFFLKSAYRVVSFDASKEMVKLCNEYPFAYCIQMTFDGLEYEEEFDGVWASASLVHIPHENLPDVFTRIFRSLKPGGIFYFSLKLKPGGQHYQDGRHFYLYKEAIVSGILSRTPFNEIQAWENTSKLSSRDDKWKSFLWSKPKV